MHINISTNDFYQTGSVSLKLELLIFEFCRRVNNGTNGVYIKQIRNTLKRNTYKTIINHRHNILTILKMISNPLAAVFLKMFEIWIKKNYKE